MNSLFSPLDRRKTVSLGDVARATGIPISTLRDKINRGELPGAFRLGDRKGNKWRLSREQIEKWWTGIQQTAVPMRPFAGKRK